MQIGRMLDIDPISEPPHPPKFMHPKCGNLCGQRGRKRFIASWGQDVTYLSLHPMPLPPRGEVKGRKSSFCPPLQ